MQSVEAVSDGVVQLPSRGRPAIGTNKGNHNHCSHGICKTNGRKNKDIKLYPFPKPCSLYTEQMIAELLGTNYAKKHQIAACAQCTKAKLWIRLCGRADKGLRKLSDIAKHTYVCAKHFVGGAGPTPEHPNPIPPWREANMNEVKKCRKPPKDRSAVVLPTSRRRKVLACKAREVPEEILLSDLETDSEIVQSNSNMCVLKMVHPSKQTSDADTQMDKHLNLAIYVANFRNPNWAVQCQDVCVNFFGINNKEGAYPSVTIQVNVTEFREYVGVAYICSVTALGKAVPEEVLASLIPTRAVTFTALDVILNELQQYDVCQGIKNEDKKVAFLKMVRPRLGYLCSQSGSIRSGFCRILTKGKRCSFCIAYSGTLRLASPRGKEQQAKKWDSRFTNYRFMSVDALLKRLADYKKQIRWTNAKLRRTTKKVALLQRKCNSSEDGDDLHQLLKKASKYFDSESLQALFIKEQLKATTRKSTRGFQWHPRLLEWCLSVEKNSWSTYKMLCKSGFFLLPSQKKLYELRRHAKDQQGAHTSDDINTESLALFDNENQDLLSNICELENA